MLQFVFNVKKIESKTRIVLSLLPILLYVLHDLLANLLQIFPNHAVSFGISLPFIELFLLVFLVTMFYFLLKEFNWWIYLIFVGGLVNFCDRLFLGYVRDYFKMVFFYNNLADLLIFVGVMLYIIENVYETSRNNLRR